MLSVPLPTTKASPNPSRVAMIPTLTPAPNYPIPLVHFLENINYPLRCTKLWFFLTRLWVPADRVFVPVEPRGGLPGSGPPEVPKHGLRPASNRDEALFHFDKPSGVPRGLSNSSVSLTSQRHLGSSLRSPVEVEGNECFPAQPKKDLESPS